MKVTLTQHDFQKAFENSIYSNKYSYAALDALWNHYEWAEVSTGEEIELDVAAIACEWSELTLADALDHYRAPSLDALEDRTFVIQLSGNVLEPHNCKLLMVNY